MLHSKTHTHTYTHTNEKSLQSFQPEFYVSSQYGAPQLRHLHYHLQSQYDSFPSIQSLLRRGHHDVQSLQSLDNALNTELFTQATRTQTILKHNFTLVLTYLIIVTFQQRNNARHKIDTSRMQKTIVYLIYRV